MFAEHIGACFVLCQFSKSHVPYLTQSTQTNRLHMKACSHKLQGLKLVLVFRAFAYAGE